MNRLTRPGVDADQSAVRFMDNEVKIQNIGDKLMELILNGPTINGVYKDTLRHILRQLYAQLKLYEDTGLTPDEVVKMQGEMKTAYDDHGDPYMLEATGSEAKRIVDLLAAEADGRLVMLPCKIDSPIYLIHEEERQKRKPQSLRVDEFDIDHFTIGGAMIPMITACSKDNEWAELIDGSQLGYEYFLSREAAEEALAKDTNVPTKKEV